jgi:hypothetical protein
VTGFGDLRGTGEPAEEPTSREDLPQDDPGVSMEGHAGLKRPLSECVDRSGEGAISGTSSSVSACADNLYSIEMSPPSTSSLCMGSATPLPTPVGRRRRIGGGGGARFDSRRTGVGEGGVGDSGVLMLSTEILGTTPVEGVRAELTLKTSSFAPDIVCELSGGSCE